MQQLLSMLLLFLIALLASLIGSGIYGWITSNYKSFHSPATFVTIGFSLGAIFNNGTTYGHITSTITALLAGLVGWLLYRLIVYPHIENPEV